MKSILRNPTRKEKRNAHRRACAAAGMPAEDQEAWGSGDPAEREEILLCNEIEGNDNAEKERLTNDLIVELSVVSRMERLARIWHEGTYRSGRLSDVPYVEHPAAVVTMLKDWGCDETSDAVTLAVAWGHDLLEDTAIGEERVRAVIGNDEVAQRVIEGMRILTFKPTVGASDHDYGQQKADYLLFVARNASPDILAVKMADRLCNTYDFYRCEEIERARAYLSCADEVFSRVGEMKYASRIQETLAECRRLVYKSTITERFSGFVRRTGELIGIGTKRKGRCSECG